MKVQKQLHILAERFSALDDERKLLFMQKLDDKSISFDQLPVVSRKSDDGAWPLSPAQQALWLASQLNPDDTSYQLSFAVDISGLLDIDNLSSVVNELYRKHSVLRLAFVEATEEVNISDAAVVQKIEPFEEKSLQAIAISQESIFAALRDDATRPIDLTEGSPLRIRL